MIFLKRFPFSSRFSRIPRNFQVDQGYQGHHGHQGHQRHQGNQGHQGLMMIGWLTNATSVDTPRLGRANWGHIWTYIVEKSQTNATNVIMHPLRRALSGFIRMHIFEKRQANATNACYYAFSYASNLRTHAKNTYCWKVKQMRPMQLCFFLCRLLEET